MRKLSYTIRRMRKMVVPHHVIKIFVNSTAISRILYCSPVTFANLQCKQIATIKRIIKLISNVSGISTQSFTETIINQHLNSCQNFAQRILKDQSHPLNSVMQQIESNNNTRSSYKNIYARTNIYKNSCVPYLARVLINPNKYKNLLINQFK